MTARSFTETWPWTEEPELWDDGTPTGQIRMRITTAACPEGYVIVVPPESLDFQRAMTVQQLWDAQGRPST